MQAIHSWQADLCHTRPSMCEHRTVQDAQGRERCSKPAEQQQSFSYRLMKRFN